jgi:Zn-finger nucleic acid-binding protein
LACDFADGGHLNGMQCPRCHTQLGEVRDAHGCAACRGIWLSNAALQGRLSGAAIAPHEHAPALCPVCTTWMQPIAIDNIELDRCFEHGVWFDGDELATLRQRRAKLEPAVETGTRQDQGGRNILTILANQFDAWF